MLKKIFLTIALLTLTQGLFAQRMNDKNSPRPPKHPNRAIMELIRIADLDQNREITGDEWQTFLNDLGLSESGTAISPEALKEYMDTHQPEDTNRPEPPQPPEGQSAPQENPFDKDLDGDIDLDDFVSIFNSLDRNQDGVLSQDDRPEPPGGSR